MSDANIMLIAGGGGGKSTFIGGLFHTARNSGLYNATYSVEVGDESEITNNVFSRMISTQRYPEKTDEAAIVRLDIDGSGWFNTGVSVEFIDIPGEQQQVIINGLMNDIEGGELDPSKIREQYRKDLASKMQNANTSLDPSKDEYDKLYRHSYIKSDKVIFLLNLHKVLFDDEYDGLAYGAGAMRKVAETRPTALVISALDVLPNAPDASSGSSDGSRISFKNMLNRAWEGATVDEETLDFLDTHLQAFPDADTIVQEAKRNPDIDVFTTSVPAENPQKEKGDLKRDGIGFETRGFEAVISWINS